LILKKVDKHYYDSGVFIGFLNEEPDNFEDCRNILLAAEQEYIELYTSAFTMSEVVYIKKEQSVLQQENIINQLFSNESIKLVQFERETAEINRYLMRTYKLTTLDALHLATAIRIKVDYFNTTDTKSLIKKVPNEVNYLPNYPKKVVIQKPFVTGFQPPLPLL
jgi:predicted nucleic acid-binding protein